MGNAANAETLRVWLFSKEIQKMPHKARKLFAYNFDHSLPIPCELIIPTATGTKTFKRRFALIQGGEVGRILGVYFFEHDTTSKTKSV